MDVYFREIAREDMPAMNRWRNDPRLIENLQAPFRYIGIDVDNAWYDSYRRARSHAVRLAIVERSQDAIVGAVYLTDIDWVARSAEFGILIGRTEDRGRGIGKYSTHCMLEHAFLNLGLNRVGLTVFPENTIACRLYRSAGFVEEGILRQITFKRGAYRDMLQMSILASDFNRTGRNRSGAAQPASSPSR